MPYIESSATKDEYLKAIGEITVQQASLEAEMAQSIGILLGADEGAGMRVTASESFANMKRLLAALFTYRINDKRKLKQFSGLVKELEKVNTNRNVNIHAVLKFFEIPDLTIVFKRRYSKFNPSSFEIDTTPPTIQSLHAISSKMQSLKEELHKLIGSGKRDIVRHREAARYLDKAKQKAIQKLRRVPTKNA